MKTDLAAPSLSWRLMEVIETPGYIRLRALLILGNVFPSELKS